MGADWIYVACFAYLALFVVIVAVMRDGGDDL